MIKAMTGRNEQASSVRESAGLSAETQARIDQSRLLRDPRVRALWPRLEPRQQQLVLDPTTAVGHRYPLSSREIAALTGLSQRQVRYWADRDLIAHWRSGNRRHFEAVGLITAFAITNANQHELRFYRSLLEDPIDDLTARVGILASVLASRLQTIERADQDTVTAPLAALSHR
jgi:DNA-binding transcriptional MerR regulator